MTTLRITARPRVTLTIVPRARTIMQLQEKGIALGAPGLSAYEVWLAEGNIGDEQDFLDSLQGEQGNPGTVLFGDKASATDAGERGWISIGDDYVYYCTQTGTAGNAIWKKTVLFQT